MSNLGNAHYLQWGLCNPTLKSYEHTPLVTNSKMSLREYTKFMWQGAVCKLYFKAFTNKMDFVTLDRIMSIIMSIRRNSDNSHGDLILRICIKIELSNILQISYHFSNHLSNLNRV